jgi:hypothetical protein
MGAPGRQRPGATRPHCLLDQLRSPVLSAKVYVNQYYFYLMTERLRPLLDQVFVQLYLSHSDVRRTHFGVSLMMVPPVFSPPEGPHLPPQLPLFVQYTLVASTAIAKASA